MLFRTALNGSALDNLDRGVVLALIGGLLANAYEVAIFGFTLTLLSAVIYGLVRNRVANVDKFSADEIEARVNGTVNLSYYTSLCRWLGSEELFYGLLDDICDSDLTNTDAGRQKLHGTLVKASVYRLRIRLLSLFGLDRFIE